MSGQIMAQAHLKILVDAQRKERRSQDYPERKQVPINSQKENTGSLIEITVGIVVMSYTYILLQGKPSDYLFLRERNPWFI